MNKVINPRPIELLAPARDKITAIAAIDHGADAVYMGASSHGARAAAGNSVDDIKDVVDYAHRFNVKVYVTVNTLIYDNEITGVEKLINDLYRIGVDALIVQDMSILKMNIPPISLHASTQCDTRTPEKARFLESVGFSQIVLARELSLDEISAIADSVSVPLEAFVHGALCVSFSGDCRASLLATGRSANRGECSQMCRLPYDLTDADGNVLIASKHLLSLKDMNRIDYLDRMLYAGVSSFKIEGRLKDVSYVKNVTAAYRQALDRIIESAPERYCRASIGKVELNFVPSLERSFNRGFTSYFLTEPRQRNIASIDTPKSIGCQVGRVIEVSKNYVVIDGDKAISNGDGLGFFDASGRFNGFRANRVDGKRIYFREPVMIKRGTMLYRNRDRMRDIEMEGRTAVRFIPVDMVLRRVSEGYIALEMKLTQRHDIGITVGQSVEISPARVPQRAARRRVLEKLGDTTFRIASLEDRLSDDDFIPVSMLASLRREAVDLLEAAMKAAYHYDYRREDKGLDYKKNLTPRDNVANRLAEKFYRDHGATSIEHALEEEKKPGDRGDVQVMECRYCLRRELGACLKQKGSDRLPSPLYLKSSSNKFLLDFDCRNCIMKVIWQR